MSSISIKKHSISTRFGITNAVIVMFFLAIIAVAMAAQISNITVRISENYVRFHSRKTVEKINLYINRELTLIRVIAESKEIINWFADEGSQEKKFFAYERFSSCADLMDGNNFYFGIEGSRNAYTVTRETTLEQFLPFPGSLNPDLPADHWYFDCLDQKQLYTLNIDIDKDLHRKRFWINYKVIDGEEIVGEVCSGVFFDGIHDQFFSKDKQNNVRIMVIDQGGLVQMDSAVIGGNKIFGPMEFEEQDKPDVREIFPFLTPAMDSCLEGGGKANGYFDHSAEVEVYRIRGGEYDFLSAVPILNTDWRVITLYKSNPLFTASLIFPLLILIAGFFIFYLVIHILTVYKLVLHPLRCLTDSLDRGESIAGLDRKDEFGELAGIIQNAMNYSRSEEERAVMLLKTNPMGCMLFDDKINFIDCNDELLRLFDLQNKKEFGEHFWDFSPEYQSNGRHSADEIRHLVELALKKGRIQFEWVHQKLDGTPLPFEIVLDRVSYGDRYLICAYARDLREQQRVDAEIKYQGALMYTVNNVAKVLFCSESENFVLEFWKCMDYLGKTVHIDRIQIWKNHIRDEELYGTKIQEWSKETEAGQAKLANAEISYSKMFPSWEKILGGGQSVKGLVRNMPRKEQKQLAPQGVLSLLVIPAFSEDNFWGFIEFDCRDERNFTSIEESCLRSGGLLIANALIRNETWENLVQAREDALAASRAKTDFLSNMSHEIRTPMNAIIGMTDIGHAASSVERKNYAFEKIGDASSHLLGVINDILDMSKIEAGKFELIPEEFDFEKMLQKTVEVITFRVEEKRQFFSVDIGREIPRFVVGDGQHLAQVIANLLSNAVKFTPEEGSITLKVLLVKKEKKDCVIQVEIIDTGIGISKEQQGRLFKSFIQAESNTSRKYGGTGLGLAISKRIVEMMNGRIWIESELGRGSRVVFFVSLKEGIESVKKKIPKKIRILAIDDDPHILDFFTEVAVRYGIACDTASSGEEALELINGSSYDVYFVDWKLPGMDGLEVSRRIMGSTEKEKPVVILISAVDWSAIEKEARELGIGTFLSKPLFPSPIIDCINQFWRVDEQPEADAGQDGEKEKKSLAGYRILAVDDVEINREILSSMMEEAGLLISCASNGKEAVRMYAENPDGYDLVFMDIQMPEMDGYEATRRIRTFEEEQLPKLSKRIPIIAMTANVFREDVEKCLASGMDDHVGKPVNRGTLFEALKKYLRADADHR
ncbi:MAG: response regulator [Treponema sp.]|nr:response regulator [Treponema sp.]